MSKRTTLALEREPVGLAPDARHTTDRRTVRMPSPRQSRLLGLAAAVLSTVTVACTPDAVTGSSAAAVHKANAALGSTSSVFTVQLRASPGDPYYGFGNLELRLGASFGDSCLPPNPISPQPGTTVVSLCGKIFNAGGALYKGGGIYQSNGLGDSFATPIASFNGGLPPNPCHRYDVAGAVTVPDAVAADMITNASSYAVRFDGQVGGSTAHIGGRFDGSAWGSVGYPVDPILPDDPYFAQKVCSVSAVP